MEKSLDHTSAHHLELLAEASRHFARSLDLNETIKLALQSVADHLKAEGASLFLLEDEGRRLVCRACVGSADITGIDLSVGDGIVGQCVSEQHAKLVDNVATDPNFCSDVDTFSGTTTRSLLCAPLTVADMRIGAIEVINKEDGSGFFSMNDLAMLQTLGSEIALAISNARMSLELIDQERIRHELNVAAEIQRNLLPRDNNTDIGIYGVNLPAYTVSGDFYDHFTLNDGKLCFCLGDVSGKGINAALMMSKTASLFRCLGKIAKDPRALIININEELCETATAGMYVTMVAGFFDPDTGIVTLVNAGHPPPLLAGREGQVQAIEDSGMPAGIMAGAQFADMLTLQRVALAGGTLYLYSDGITELKLENGSRLTEDGFVTMLRDTPSLIELHSRVAALIERLEAQASGAQDDITLLALEDQRSQLSDTRDDIAFHDRRKHG